jgi:ABC-2 type transport system permease protein
MVRKELTRYFKTPVWLTNTAIGLVIFVVAVGAVCFKFDDLVNSLINSVEGFPLTVYEIRAFVPSITVAMVAFTSLMTFITAPMISLEGRAFNMLKSLPISGVKIIMTKVLSAMILIVPVTAVGSLLMFIKFQFGVIDLVLILLAVFFMPLVTELVGILVDLKYARFDAESDAVTVRQSASVMVATFMGLGMVLLTVSLIFGLVFLAGQTAGLLMVDAIFVIVALFLYFTIVARGGEKIMKLVA